ncbi:MAG: FHA domain-containing protein [Prevotella sp.]|nr:FHA domain-containing protein [Prevotella sp.]
MNSQNQAIFDKLKDELKKHSVKPQPASKPKDKDETEFGLLSASQGKPTLTTNGKPYYLRMGRNTVGRRSGTSAATLQIETADMYMSRVNAVIEVSKSTNGEWHVIIASCNENNLVKIDGHSLHIGDRVVLQPGNIIRLGHSDIAFTYE